MERTSAPYQGQLVSPLTLWPGSINPIRAHFKVRLIVSDLCAKCHILNMMKFNGYHGCHFCTAEGVTIGKTHAYYRYHKSGQLRDASINNLYVYYAENLDAKKPLNVVGVKGQSAFADLADGLPLTAPIDYMHCVLLGVFQELLKLCYKSLSSDDKTTTAQIVSDLSCPREMIAYSRKIRSLEELSQFKANEYFNWLLNLSPLIFLSGIPRELYEHLCSLVFGVRLLFESSMPSVVSAAEIFLDKFCREIVSIHKNDRIKMINVHCIKHSAEQAKRFGPLWCYPAMSFEAANRTLGDVFSGSSHSECEIICRGVLQRHNLVYSDIVEPHLKPVFDKLSRDSASNLDSFDKEFIETEALRAAKLCYLGVKFLNRHFNDRIYFDSTCYKRSKRGNCFVRFAENGEERFGQILSFIQETGPQH